MKKMMKKVLYSLLVAILMICYLPVVMNQAVNGYYYIPVTICVCDEHKAAPINSCHCCIMCPNMDTTYLSGCATKVEQDGEEYWQLCCEECTGMIGCECGGGCVVEEACEHWYRGWISDKYLRTQATCTEPATYWYSCNHCGASAENDENVTDKYFICNNALGHIDENYDGTCDRDGCNAVVEVPYNVVDGKLTAGENLIWSFDEATATLTISGEGPMYDFSWVHYENPWKKISNKVESIVVEAGVTTIGTSSFLNFYNLTDVILPDTVTEIGGQSFTYCRSLKEITIPESVKKIGWRSFGSTRIESVYIPKNVNLIENSAFEECDNLKKIIVDENNQYYCSDENGILFNKDKTELIRYPSGLANTSYKIPDTVKTIGDNAFDYCTNLTNVEIPDGVISIGDYAFNSCYSLTSVTIPSTVKEVGSSAFGFSGYYNNKNNWIDGVLCVDHCLVGVNNNVTEVTIPDNITVISKWAFSRADIKEIIIPGRIKTIEGYTFSECKNLEKVVVEDGVSYIGENAFSGCTKLSEINLPDSIEYIGRWAVHGTAYYNDENNWQNGVLIIGNCIVDIKDNVTEIYINDEIKYVVTDIFDGEALVEKITVDDNNLYYSSDEYGVLYNKDKTKLIAYPMFLNKIEYTVPDTVTEIELMWSVYLKTLKLPESVEKINQMYLLKLKDVIIENDSIEIIEDSSLCMSTIDFSKPDFEQLFDEYVALWIKAAQGIGTEEELERAQEISMEIQLDVPMPCGTIHANPGSNAHKYALENGIDFKPLENEEPHTCSFGEWFTETAPTVFSEGVSKRVCDCGKFETKPIAKLESAVTKDETTNIEITYTEENFESEVEIVVSEEEINANIVFGDEFENFKSFDISLEADGEKVQPKGYVTVKLPIPADFNAETTVVYYVDDSGNKTKLESTTENGYIVFETDHFSEYVLVDESSRIEPPHIHSYTSAVTKNPTCTEAGVKTFTCTCGETYTEEIAATGHDFDGSECKNCDYDKADTCGCNCHKGGFMGFIWKIINFFNKLFKSKQYCACGAKHY